MGDSLPQLICLMRWVIKTSNMAVAYADHNRVDAEMKASGLNFVIARPTRLTEGNTAPVKTFGNQGVGLSGFSGISRASVARFLVDAVDIDTWDRSTPVISN